MIIVDDDTQIVKTLVRFLSRCGFVVTAFTSALAALNHLQNRIAPIHVFLIDMVMPEMDGIQFVLAVEGFNAAKILFSGAYVEPDREKILKEAGCRFIAKPILDLDFFRDLLIRSHLTNIFCLKPSRKTPPKTPFSVSTWFETKTNKFRSAASPAALSSLSFIPLKNKEKESPPPSESKGKNNKKETPETSNPLISNHSPFHNFFGSEDGYVL